MTSNAQILSDLRVIMETQHTLELMNTFKGVPFICRGKAIRVGEDQVQIETTDPTIACLVGEKQVKVLGSDYFEPSIATIVAVDLANGLVTLSNFSYLGSKLGERMIVRVAPKTPIEASIKNESVNTIAQVLDLSISGIGLKLIHADYDPTLRPGATVRIGMRLPNGDVQIAATILSAVRASDGHRLSLRFSQDGPQKVTIFRYLVDRRSEIEKELLEVYHQGVTDSGQQVAAGPQPARQA
jgi:hypothetical protein